MNEYNDCLKTIRELARAIRSNGLSAADRNMMAGALTIIATKLERLMPANLVTVEEAFTKQGEALAEYREGMSASGPR